LKKKENAALEIKEAITLGQRDERKKKGNWERSEVTRYLTKPLLGRGGTT